jgi:excisionase family DNA binding protein
MRSHEPLAYGPKEAAAIIGIGLTALYAEIAAGRIPIKKFGRRTLIASDGLKSWLATLPMATPPAAASGTQ